MKRLFFILLIVCACSKDEKQIEGKSITVVLLGDSNASGGIAICPENWPDKYSEVSERSIILYKNDRTSKTQSFWTEYNPEVNRLPGYGPPGKLESVGIDNTLIWYLKENYTHTIRFLKWSLGGTSLINDWSGQGKMIQSFKEYAPNGLKADAVIICLGTNDVHKSIWNKTDFTNKIPSLVQTLRDEFEPDTPIFWIQVRADLKTQANYPLTDEAREVLLNASESIPNFYLVDYDNLKTLDGVHLDLEGNEFVGLDMGKRILEII